MTGLSYEIITPAGVTIRTCDSAELARKFVLANKKALPGLSIDEVEVTVTRRRIHQPRQVRRAA